MGPRASWALVCAMILSLFAGATSPASAATISGRADKTPWSGYWWPMLNTYTYKLYNSPGPMSKYDAYSKATGGPGGAYSWEYRTHRTTNQANDWWGHCHAWAAASIMEPQPPAATKAGVSFSQDDAEGLYAETYHRIFGWMYGTHYSTGGSSEAYNDVHPAVFDEQVRYWIGQQKRALVMDFDPGNQVWNYPVYAFSRSSTWSGKKEYVTMTVTRARPYYGYNGTASQTKTFYYTLQGGTNGLWHNPTGSSVNTHPDYIIRVDGRATDYGNPYVKPAVLDGAFRPARAQAAAPERPSVAGDAAQGVAAANRMGWRLGTEWTIKVRQYGAYQPEPEWVGAQYRFRVEGVGRDGRSFTVSMRFADPASQPESARGELLRIGYTLEDGNPRLGWVRPRGEGAAVSPSKARALLGDAFFSLEIPSKPFSGGRGVAAEAPGLGGTRANELRVGPGETAAFAEGAPWWVSYSKGNVLKAELASFKR